MAKTTAEFLDGIKRRITMPANQVLLQDQDILDVGSDIIRLKMSKLLQATNQNYMLATADIPLVASQTFYDVPYRAVANGIESIKYVYDDGLTFKGLSYVNIDDLSIYSPTTATYPEGFYFQADQIGLIPSPASTLGTLRIWYSRQPSKLCLVSNAGKITNIATNVVTVDNAPTSFVSGVTIDFVKARSLTAILAQDITITNVSGTQLTFATADMPSRLAVGDWIALAQTTPLLPFPDECYKFFEGSVGVTILGDALGDYEGAQRLQGSVDADKKDIESLLEPRIENEPEKIISYSSLLRQKAWRPFGSFRR